MYHVFFDAAANVPFANAAATANNAPIDAAVWNEFADGLHAQENFLWENPTGCTCYNNQFNLIRQIVKDNSFDIYRRFWFQL